MNDARDLSDEEEDLWYAPYEKIFIEILNESHSYKSYHTPHQLTYEVPNMPSLKLRPVLDLLMHEYQEYLHQPVDIEFDTIFTQVCYV